jgi:hypothetical protein
MALQMEPGVLLLIAGAQLMFAAIVNALVPFFVIFPKGMAKRR